MEPLIIAIFILVGFVLLIGLWMMAVYNKLVRTERQG